MYTSGPKLFRPLKNAIFEKSFLNAPGTAVVLASRHVSERVRFEFDIFYVWISH